MKILFKYIKEEREGPKKVDIVESGAVERGAVLGSGLPPPYCR